ncbi:plexin-C1 isoform X1 [Oreochromis niloticus]|uniref:plexin-C1 isoform X1 n=1 Tax=Oreochromis niloticus TaxID=8128 RepID=UPI000DF1B3BD|nr:plexin-C1-like isoform X1 [Oreochromis niloticus]
MVFDISPDYSRAGDRDPDFYTSVPSEVTVTVLKPKAVLFRHSYMTSVLAVRQRGWMVFFIGTGDGQLIKRFQWEKGFVTQADTFSAMQSPQHLTSPWRRGRHSHHLLSVDRKYHAACPTVLYRTSDDRKVIPNLHLDPVDRKHVYVPFRNQMKRVPVSKCSTYTNVQECWSAQDPYCGWCDSKSSCTFEDDCTDSDWLSIPDESQHKMISHKVEKDTNGQVLLKMHTHLIVGQKVSSNFICQFTARSSSICAPNNPPPQFPQCTCILSDRTLPADGLHVTVKFRLGSTQLSEQLRLTNCSDISGPPSSVLCQQCIKAGCRWNINRCSWADQTEINDSVCQNVQSGKNFSIPEISSITPSVVSFYGRNHAVLSGRNLDDVTAVRIQADTDCAPKESPVWDNTGFSLMFHIPTSDIKGVVSVCLLLPDGRCHGKAKITYSSLPSCTNITPSSSWISGKRKITLMGSHLNFVEGVVHSHAMQDVRLPRNISSQYLTYDSPAARSFSSSTLFVKLANETLACSTKLSYVPDPEFTSFTATRTGEDVHITIQKKADNLEMMIEELSVWGIQDNTKYQCIMEAKETWTNTDFFTCGFKSPSNHEFEELLIKYGDRTVSLGLSPSYTKPFRYCVSC